jgi:bifunctional UDP-N-acetylglucosamine pyrophosphorylase / glucosamine-1-phosphate N-acetyltransferase
MNIVILAAGQGKRMNSAMPKVLQPLAGKTLARHVVDTATQLQPDCLCVVVGYGSQHVELELKRPGVCFALQQDQLGTGHAVRQAIPMLSSAGVTLILYADVPLITVETLQRVVSSAETGMCLLTVNMQDPTGYGRIVRDAEGSVSCIVEQKDANAEQRLLSEINTGIMAVNTANLARWLGALDNKNAQNEYYLTDIVRMAFAEGIPIKTVAATSEWEVLGVNDKAQLAALERRHQLENAEKMLNQGVRLADPARIDVRGTISCGRDVSIDVGCIFEGVVSLGDSVEIGPYAVLKNATVGSGTRIAAFTHAEGVRIANDCVVGPYARLRPGTDLAAETHIGNFVEIKNSAFGFQSKANHLAYVGDATVGQRVNIGAGTITCNYDGAAKHRTVIEDDVFIGSDTQLVAPVTVGRGATLGAGTTLTKDAPPDQLTVSRARQVSLAGWKRPQKSKK